MRRLGLTHDFGKVAYDPEMDLIFITQQCKLATCFFHKILMEFTITYNEHERPVHICHLGSGAQAHSVTDSRFQNNIKRPTFVRGYLH